MSDEYPKDLMDKRRKKVMSQYRQMKSERRERNFLAILGCKFLFLITIACLVLGIIFHYLIR